MYATILCLAMLSQTGIVSNSRYVTSLDKLAATTDADAERALFDHAKSREVAFQERQFVDSFNELLDAMQKFSDRYKSQHSIDVKNVELIRKAYRNLEKTEPWFKVR